MSHVDERPPRPGNRAYPAARQTPRTPAAGRRIRPPPPAILCRPPSPLSGTRLSGRQASIARRRPRPPGTTSRRTSHMAVLTVAPRRAWPPHPQWARARHAITLAVKRGRDHQAKGDTEAATRPTPEHDGTRDRRLPALRHPPAHRSHHHRSPGPATDARGNYPAASPRTAGTKQPVSPHS